MSVTASWPLPRLVSAIARAGWDELAGRRGGGYRAVLRALADLLPERSAVGLVTAPQIADAAGITERWARHILTGLEEAGVIAWTRGTIVDGRPQPSLIKVSKKVLAALVQRSRSTKDARLAARAAETSKRIRETLRMRTLYRSQRRRPAPAASPAPRAELSATLPPFRGGSRGPEGPALPLTDTGQTVPGTQLGKVRNVGSRSARLRSAIGQLREQSGDPEPATRPAVTP